MVDSGPIHPSAVIDFSNARKSTPVSGGSPALAPTDPEALLNLPFLKARLKSHSKQVSLWAAYQLMDRHQDSAEEFMEALWTADYDEIRESAVNLVGKYALQDYAFPLLRLFDGDSSSMSLAAGRALAQLRYEPAERMLFNWFQSLVPNPDAKRGDIEAAASSLLLFDPNRHWQTVAAWLEPNRRNHAIFSTLFAVLARHARTREHVETLASAYLVPREVFHDFQLTQSLVDLVGQSGVNRYLQGRLGAGYPLLAIYSECLRVLGLEISQEAQQLLGELAQCGNSTQGVRHFARLLEPLTAALLPGHALSPQARGFIHGSQEWLGRWDEAILKVREVEYALLASLPLVRLVSHVEAQCLANPHEEALRISQVYQSPLISPQFMEQVLNLLTPRPNQAGASALESVSYSSWLRDEEKDALWKLSTGQLDELDYPFDQVLPTPWLCAVPHVLERFKQILLQRFSGYLLAGRRQSVDYCLEVFRRLGGSQIVPLCLGNFEQLINRHYHGLIELITHIPDMRFLAPLVRHFRAGESELSRLIRFICDVHQLPYPAVIQRCEETGEQQAPGLTVRLSCGACGSSYQYPVSRLFVNEDCLDQRQVPGIENIWSPEKTRCKNCERTVAFEPDDGFLQDLYSELLARQLFTVSDGPGVLEEVRVIQFPTLNGTVRHPDLFLPRAQAVLNAAEPGAEDTKLLLELGRFQMEVERPEAAKTTLRKILSGPQKCPLALYLLGVLAFQEKNIYEARLHFSQLTSTSSREEFGQELDNPHDMAHHYLKLLDKREFKRSHFQLISS